ncbi:phosphoketolase [Mycena maculata]|uniref:Phosphoketolase n=1 Tax=Mycena maculata TaxID=230809 RepID=A0AAD7IYJ7_9AGAR|nr:phosphoketolase [Mycena maculata]
MQLDTKNHLSSGELKSVKMFRRAADYIAAGTFLLFSSSLSSITHDDIKSRLLGHWGTCSGLAMVYEHVNRLIWKTGLDALYVVGPRHDTTAILSCLWLEDSLSTFYPENTRDYKGFSHIGTPGAIHEGGELGYALGVSFGAVMDNTDLVAETGTTATAWHGLKHIDPCESGAMLPIVHELTALFTYVQIVEDVEYIDNDLAASMDWALAEIKKIQSAARSGNPIVKPRRPMLILCTPFGPGWTVGPKQFHGEFVEGSFHSHQVPLPGAKTSAEELAALQAWLKSYRPEELFSADGVPVPELFSADGGPVPEVLSVIPEDSAKRLGERKESFRAYSPLAESCTKAVGRLLKGAVEENPQNFRIFSLDELVSNKLDAVFDESGRNFQCDCESPEQGGRIIEILSEHTCKGMLQDHTLTGRTAMFPSYEAFLGLPTFWWSRSIHIVQTMMVQYSKFTKMSAEIPWLQPCGSLNYLEMSTWARQEHNEFLTETHNRAVIGAVLNLKPITAHVYLPPDANCFLSTMAHCLRPKDYVNVMVGSKQPTPVWLSPEDADKFASVDDGVNPDLVLVGIGVKVTFEFIAAAALRVRVADLMILSATGSYPHALTDVAFDSLFMPDKFIHFHYHECPIELNGLLFGRPNLDSVALRGPRPQRSIR